MPKMLYMRTNVLYWLVSVSISLIFSIIPHGHVVFPTIMILQYVSETATDLSTNTNGTKTEKKAEGDQKDSTSTKLHPATSVFKTMVLLFSLGAAARFLCLYGPQNTDNWATVAIFHTLLVFGTIGRSNVFSKVPTASWNVLPCVRVRRGPKAERKSEGKSEHAFYNQLFYSQVCGLIITVFEVQLFNFALQELWGYDKGIFDILHIPCNKTRSVHVAHLFIYYFLLLPFIDTAETIFFALHHRYAALIPTVEELTARATPGNNEYEAYDAEIAPTIMGYMLVAVGGAVIWLIPGLHLFS